MDRHAILPCLFAADVSEQSQEPDCASESNLDKPETHVMHIFSPQLSQVAQVPYHETHRRVASAYYPSGQAV